MISPYEGKFRISQVFKGEKHKGKDFVGVTSKKIFSTVNGVVVSARRDLNPNNPNDPNYGMGNYVKIRDDETGHLFYFAHLSKVMCVKGDRVKIGQQIGVEGSTGHSTGSHLHYEVRKEDSNMTFIDSTELSGIPNERGTYVQGERKLDAVIDPDIVEAMKVVKEKTGFSDATMKKLYDSFDNYQYEESFWVKLADAMR